MQTKPQKKHNKSSKHLTHSMPLKKILIHMLNQFIQSSLLLKTPPIPPEATKRYEDPKLTESSLQILPFSLNAPNLRHRKRENAPYLGKLRRTDHAVLAGGPSGEDDLALSARGKGFANSLANCQQPRHASSGFGVERAVVAA